MMDLIHRESVRRIIDSPRSKEQMLAVLDSLPSANPDLTDEEWRQVKQLRSYHNGSYAQVLDKLIASKQTGRDKPIKPDKTIDHAWGIKSVQAICPKCDCYLGAVYFLADSDKKITYCETCGQAIDWSEWEWDAERQEV